MVQKLKSLDHLWASFLPQLTHSIQSSHLKLISLKAFIFNLTFLFVPHLTVSARIPSCCKMILPYKQSLCLWVIQSTWTYKPQSRHYKANSLLWVEWQAEHLEQSGHRQSFSFLSVKASYDFNYSFWKILLHFEQTLVGPCCYWGGPNWLIYLKWASCETMTRFLDRSLNPSFDLLSSPSK